MTPVRSNLFSDLKIILSTILKIFNVRNDFRILATTLLKLCSKDQKELLEVLVKNIPTEDIVTKKHRNRNDCIPFAVRHPSALRQFF